MRTRTLLLLAVGCGLVILIAGVVQLLRISGQEETARAEVGTPVSIGDLTVNVTGLDEVDGQAVVAVDVGGVVDADGTDEFRLVVPGASLRATGAGAADAPPCAETAVEVRRCSLTFDVTDVEGTSRVLLYRRGDAQVRWDLAGDVSERSD